MDYEKRENLKPFVICNNVRFFLERYSNSTELIQFVAWSVRVKHNAVHNDKRAVGVIAKRIEPSFNDSN